MNASVQIFVDLTVSQEGREVKIKADGKTINIFPLEGKSILKQAKYLAKILGDAESVRKFDHFMESAGLKVVVHLPWFRFVVFGTGASRVLRSIFLFWGKFGSADRGFK